LSYTNPEQKEKDTDWQRKGIWIFLGRRSDPVPDEELPPKETLGFRVQRYGILKWGNLFNSRQKLALITFTEKVRQAYQRMTKEGYNEEYAKAVVGYLGLGVNRLADRNSSLSIWNNIAEKQEHTFGRQALPMCWDYAETNVIEGVQGWKKQFGYLLSALENLSHLSQIPPVQMEEDENELER